MTKASNLVRKDILMSMTETHCQSNVEMYKSTTGKNKALDHVIPTTLQLGLLSALIHWSLHANVTMDNEPSLPVCVHVGRSTIKPHPGAVKDNCLMALANHSASI